ncbi:MAG: hypothetical protein ABH884_00820 [Candidatus Komeilibacteria bacterium]
MWNLTDNICLTTWDGIFFGEPGDPDWDVRFAFAYQAIDLTFGNFGVGYSVLHYLEDKPMNLPAVKYTFDTGTNDQIKTSVTYNVRDGSPMFFIGWTHSL